MAGLAGVVDELATMLEPLRIGRRRAPLTLVERDGRYECFRNRRRRVVLARGDIDRLGPGAVPREMTKHGVEVRLDPARVLNKVLSLPAASRNYLDAIVAHQLERMTPWTADRVVFDYTLADGSAGNDQITVRLVAIARDAFERLVEQLRSAGLKLSVVGTSDDALDEPSPINLLGTSRAARRRALRRTVTVALAALLLLGATASAYSGWRLYTTQQKAATLQEEMRQARNAVEAAMSNSEANEGVRRLLDMKLEAVPTVRLIERLSEVIPTTTYLSELTIEGEELRIVGFSSDAPALIETLERADILYDVRFGAPTVRDPGAAQDRFEIVAHTMPLTAPE